jgi:hypothetical protein
MSFKATDILSALFEIVGNNREHVFGRALPKDIRASVVDPTPLTKMKIDRELLLLRWRSHNNGSTYRANGKKCSQFGIYQQLAALVRTIEHSAVMHLPHHQIGDDDGDGGDDKSGACFAMHVRTTTMTMMTLIAMKGTIARLSAYLTRVSDASFRLLCWENDPCLSSGARDFSFFKPC